MHENTSKHADSLQACAGTFRLTIEFSEEYPNKAPVVKFKSNMFHPNSARPYLDLTGSSHLSLGTWEGAVEYFA